MGPSTRDPVYKFRWCKALGFWHMFGGNAVSRASDPSDASPDSYSASDRLPPWLVLIHSSLSAQHILLQFASLYPSPISRSSGDPARWRPTLYLPVAQALQLPTPILTGRPPQSLLYLPREVHLPWLRERPARELSTRQGSPEPRVACSLLAGGHRTASGFLHASLLPPLLPPFLYHVLSLSASFVAPDLRMAAAVVT